MIHQGYICDNNSHLYKYLNDNDAWVIKIGNEIRTTLIIDQVSITQPFNSEGSIYGKEQLVSRLLSRTWIQVEVVEKIHVNKPVHVRINDLSQILYVKNDFEIVCFCFKSVSKTKKEFIFFILN